MEPDEIVSWMRNGHARTAGLVAAVRLGVLDRLARDPADLPALARDTGITRHAARVLGQFLHAGGVLVTPSPGTYATAPGITGAVRAELAGAVAETAARWSRQGAAARLLHRGETGEIARDWSTLTPVPASPDGAGWALDLVRQGYLRARCVTTAVELGLISTLRGGPVDTAGPAARPAVRPEPDHATRPGPDRGGVEVALDGLCRLGVCERTPAGVALRPAAASLLGTDRSLAAFELAAGLTHHFWTALGALDDVARTGRLTFDLQDPVTASRYYLRLARYNSLVFPGYLGLAESVVATLPDRADRPAATVVDVGAGSGVWAAAFARAWPDCRLTLLDREPVLAQTRANLARIGAADRCTFTDADLSTGRFGDGAAEVVVLGQICHTQPEATLPHLLRRCAQALRPGGLLLLADMVLDDNGTGPAAYLDFAIKELVGTGGGVLTESSYRQLLAEAGFTDVTLRRFAELDVLLAVAGRRPGPAHDRPAHDRPADTPEVTP